MDEEIKAIKNIISHSGNSFHFKVLNYLEKKKWKMLISPYYSDNITNKPREIDLIAKKMFSLNTPPFRTSCDNAIVTLFFECKYITQKTVFWFHGKDEEKAKELITKDFPECKNLSTTLDHHYLSNQNSKAAKLFADERKKSSENEAFYKALNQSLNALIYYRGQGAISNRPQLGSESRTISAYYPVIICNSFDNLYKVDLSVSDSPSKIEGDFQLEINYGYLDTTGKSINEFFLIDIVSFQQIDEYLGKIESDLNVFNDFLQRT
jgi:hypothetical protein